MRRLSLVFVTVLVVMAAALPALAADPSAPVVTTGAAGGIGTKAATLNGTVDPSGASTIYWFEYGTTTSYGLQTGTHGAGSGTSARPVSAHIAGLVAGTTYHYRLVAQNSAGTTDGLDQTFTTSAANAPLVTTGAASGIGAKTATLNGTVNPNGASTTYWFQYGTTSSYGLQTGTHGAGSGTSGRSVSTGISGLVAGTTYHFRLVAQSSAGTTDGQDQTFTTSAAAAPQVTTGAAGGIGAKTATLNGTVNPNGAGTNYWFQYGTTTGYGLQTGTHSVGEQHLRPARLGRSLRPCRRHDLSLPPRRAEQRRHHGRARSDIHDLRSERAKGDDRGRERDRREDGDRERDGQPERCLDDLLVPVRNNDGLRPADRQPRRGRRHI